MRDQATPDLIGVLPANGGRLLAVRGGALGDFILTLPALRELRMAGWHLELLTRPAYGELAETFGHVAAWRSLDSAKASALMLDDAPVDAEWQQWLRSFDVVLSWLPDGDGAFQRQLARCGPQGFFLGDWRCADQTPAAGQLGAVELLKDSTGALLVPFDLFSGNPGPLPGSSGHLALHPGSGSPRKNWPVSRWLEVLHFIEKRSPGTHWMIITGEAENEELAGLEKGLRESGISCDFATSLPLPALARKLRSCAGFFGHDSGISHLAAACGIPCHLVFGPTNPKVWAPMGDHVRVATAPGGNLEALSAHEAMASWNMEALSD